MEKKNWKEVCKKGGAVLFLTALVLWFGFTVCKDVKPPDSGGLTFSEMCYKAAEFRGEEITENEIEAYRNEFMKIAGAGLAVGLVVSGILFYAGMHPENKWVGWLAWNDLDENGEKKKGGDEIK